MRLLLFLTVGILLAVGGRYLYVALADQGLFASWQLVNSSRKFETIVDAATYRVWAKTDSGQIFQCSVDELRRDCGMLPAGSSIQHRFINEPRPQRMPSCRDAKFTFMKDPPGDIIECVYVFYIIESDLYGGVYSFENRYFALTEDGDIWNWYLKIGKTALSDIVMNCLSLLVGLALGATAFYSSRKARGLKGV